MNDTLMGLQMSTREGGPSPTVAKVLPPLENNGQEFKPQSTSNSLHDAFALWRQSSQLLEATRVRLLAETSREPPNGRFTASESAWLRLVTTFPINELEEVTR